MASEYDILEFLESDYTERNLRRKRVRLQLRYKCDPFNIEETEFIKRFRLTKKLVRNLCNELKTVMNVNNKYKKRYDLSVESKVLIALSFYASGSYQDALGNDEGHFVSQQTVSKVIKQVTSCLNSDQIGDKYIKFPSTNEECMKTKTEFYNKLGIPGVLGCITCTQVAIKRPAQYEKHYYCREKYYSINVQLVCDANMQILSVDAGHGGAIDASSIWATHPLRTHLEYLSNTEYNDTWFLGDSRYPLSKYMMTPMLDVTHNSHGSPEAHYAHLHDCARNITQCTIAALKGRFRCLLANRPLHYSPEIAGSIINACVILHNICNKAKVPLPQLSPEDIIQEAQLQQHDNGSEGLSTSNYLVQHLCETRLLKS